jgi:hypothetical protein
MNDILFQCLTDGDQGTLCHPPEETHLRRVRN